MDYNNKIWFLKTIVASPKKKTPKKKKKGCTEYSSLSIVVASLKKKPHAPKEGTKWGMCPWLVVLMIILLLLLLLHKEVSVRSSAMIWGVDYPNSQWEKKKGLISLIQSRVRWTLSVVMSPIWIRQQSPNWSNALFLCSFGFTLGGALHCIAWQAQGCDLKI